MDYAKGWIQSQPAHEAESLPLECLRMNPFPALPPPPDNIQPEDSTSTTSSQRSASARKRTEAECAGLLAKAKALEKKHKLDLEAARIKTQQEKVELEADMAAATAKPEVLSAISTPPRIKGATSQPIVSTVRADTALWSCLTRHHMGSSLIMMMMMMIQTPFILRAAGLPPSLPAPPFPCGERQRI